MSNPSTSRLSNLDLVRALAVSMVVFFHLIEKTPNCSYFVRNILGESGRYGVDIFFALSGFLIGGLYWQEVHRFGNVESVRFILRRVVRTVPPYFVAMLLAYIAVRITRPEPFHPAYLFMVQNYLPKMPYFVLSWSLCIEEHFYLFLPFVLIPILLLPVRRQFLAMLLLALVPPLLRAFVGDSRDFPFLTFNTTATHFRFDGLMLGVLASYIATFHAERIRPLLRYKAVIYIFAAALTLLIPCLPAPLVYKSGLFALGLAYAASILLLSEDRSYFLGRTRLIQLLALCSYSTYLTHIMVIHACERFHPKLAILVPIIMLIAIIPVAAMFYLLVEKTAIKLRDRLVPRRPRLQTEATEIVESSLSIDSTFPK